MRGRRTKPMPATEPGWSHLEHGADIGVRGEGATPAEAFAQAALAMTALVTDLDRIEPSEAVVIDCAAPELDYLLVDWLNALIYEMATRAMLFGRFDVRIDGEQLSATAFGEPVDPRRHRPVVEIKGATLTGLKVAETAPGHWTAECIVDV